MLTYPVILLALLALASFSWGLSRHFRARDGMPRGMRALTAASSAAAILFLVLLVRNGVGAPEAAVSLLLSAAALGLFWWAVAATRHQPPHLAHTGDMPDMLHQGGPYAYVRHPFYLAYCLFWLGSAVAAGGVQWLAAALLILWYFATARGEEARFLQSSIAASYADYRRRTGMILPKPRELWRR